MNSHLSQSFEMTHTLKFHSSPQKNDAWPFKQKKRVGWKPGHCPGPWSILYPRLICLSSRPKTKMRFPTRFRSMPEVEQTTSELRWSQKKTTNHSIKKSQWNSSIFNVSFSDCLILWSCSLLSNCNLLTIVASILFFQNAMLSSLRHECCLKILSFLSSETSVEVGSPEKTQPLTAGRMIFCAEKKLLSWEKPRRLEVDVAVGICFSLRDQPKKTVCCGDHDKCKKMSLKKNLNMSFILGTFFHLFSLTKLLTSWWFQPRLQNMLVNMGSSSPSFGVKIPKTFETTA